MATIDADFFGKLLRLLGLILLACSTAFLMFYLFSSLNKTSQITPDETIPGTPPPFPIGVNPQTKTIIEQPNLTSYVEQFVASNHTAPRRTHSLAMLIRSQLEQFIWYQQLATPSRRTVVIWSGDRREQIAEHFQSILGWSDEETALFQELVTNNFSELSEGMYYPGRYQFNLPVSPEIAALTINQKFSSEVLLRYSPAIEVQIPLEDTLVIASLIEREAYDFEDMRLISGVIWNRLFIDMPLQLDATLQYARGHSGTNRTWWPIPRSADKFIESPYNTYQTKGLPPEPIANPSLDAIVATLNPRLTDCLFYFHTADGTFMCSQTYEEHTKLIEIYLK